MRFFDTTHRQRLRFLLLFVAGVSLLAAAFSQWQSLFDKAYLYPVSSAAARLLNLLGVPTRLEAGSASLGFCLLVFEDITFRVIHECTGIFALFIFLAALLAYPASLYRKGRGLLESLLRRKGHQRGRALPCRRRAREQEGSDHYLARKACHGSVPFAIDGGAGLPSIEQAERGRVWPV